MQVSEIREELAKAIMSGDAERFKKAADTDAISNKEKTQWFEFYANRWIRQPR